MCVAAAAVPFSFGCYGQVRSAPVYQSLQILQLRLGRLTYSSPRRGGDHLVEVVVVLVLLLLQRLLPLDAMSAIETSIQNENSSLSFDA